jgi:hypothetical protein
MQIINTFAYETIRKWLPSHLRSKNPGPDDCLDIQIETDKGPRDLRMRCSSVNAVKQLMKDLRDTVQVRRVGGAQLAATLAYPEAGDVPNPPLINVFG